MASRTIYDIVTDDHMQLDKVIDNYFNFESSCDPNPLTSGNINSLYHDIDTVGLQHLKDYKQNSKFSCMHLNIRSLPDKFDKFKLFLTNLDNEKIQFDAILLCETFLTDTNRDLFNIPGYTFISRHRKHYRQGGVGIYIKNNINFIIRDDLSIFIEKSFETLFLEVTSSKGSILIGEVYRVPNSSCPNSITNYELITNKLQNENKEIIIGTDQNFDYLNIHCAYSKHLLETFFAACLVPTITRPTRITSESATLIDNIYVSGNRLEYIRSGILVADISDHFPIFLFTGKKVRHCKPKNNTNSYRKLDSTAIDRINSLLLATDWSPLQQLHVNDQFDFVNTKLLEYINICAPIKVVTIPAKYVIREKWMTKGLLQSSLNLQKMRKRETGKTSSNLYRSYRNLYNRLVRIAKTMHYTALIDRYKGDIAHTWQVLNEITGKRKKSELCDTFNINNVPTNDANTISNSFCNYFTNIGQQCASTIGQATTRSSNYLKGNYKNSLFLIPTTPGDIIAIISCFKSKASSGHDGVSSKLVKDLRYALSFPLSIIINNSLAMGLVPDMAKLAKIIPIYKAKDKKDISNYRPISLLPIISKILEKVVHKNLYTFLEKNKVRYASQYGFRKNRSTINAITELVCHITNAIENKQNTLSVFLDLSKAFDTIDHNILLHKLEFYGVRGLALNWFQSYLTDRKQYVLYNNVQSQTLDITCGVPQGSVLGPLLFLIYVNDIANCLTHSKLISFADDTTVFLSSKCINDLYNNMNSDLDDLTNWFKANRLPLNVNKSNYMLFQPNGNQNTLGNTLNIGVDQIEHKLNCKFLGIFIDNQLRWNNHLSHISAKLSRSVYILKTVKHILPLTLLRSLYYTMVQPYLTYGIILWGPTYRCHVKQVSILQKKVIRCINKLHYNAHTEPLFIRNKILRLDDLYKFELSKFMFDCINGLLPTPILEYFTTNATIHAHHTRQRNIPHVTQTFGTNSERAVTHKGQKIWTEIPQPIRLHQNKNIFSRLLKNDYITKYN